MPNNNSTKKMPSVFMSYSHDSPQHKEWVAELATRLRKEGGADVILDQWDTEHGDDLVKFMEKSVIDVDRVLMVCTTAYVQKANDGKGGVGYETMVVTGEMVHDLGTTKFIPIIPPENTNATVPTCVSTRKYVDLRKHEVAESAFDELVRSLHHIGSLMKPPVALNDRFRVVEYAASDYNKNISNGSTKLEYPMDFHRQATLIIRNDDYIAWQGFVRETRQSCLEKLLKFRQEKESKLNVSTFEEIRDMVMEAASFYSPMISIALAGIESGSERYRNQISVLSDILNPGGWIRSGRSILVELPKAMAYLYQALNGAMCVESRQFDLASILARSPLVLENKVEPLFKHNDITGWVESLGRKYTDCASFLFSLPKHWGWLKALFQDDNNFESCVSCYYILLLTTDLIERCRTQTMPPESYQFDVPPFFWHTTPEVATNAMQKLLNEADQVRALWKQQNIPGIKVAEAWDMYCKSWSESGSESFFMFRSMNSFINPIRALL